jgi:hypothetical protein
VDPVTPGDPESALRWTCKSTQILSTELLSHGIEISDRTLAKLLRIMATAFRRRTRPSKASSIQIATRVRAR